MKFGYLRSLYIDTNVKYFIPFIDDEYKGIVPIGISKYDDYDVIDNYTQDDRMKVLLSKGGNPLSKKGLIALNNIKRRKRL